MADQMRHSFLLEMPILVIGKILSNFHNLTNVSCTCKYLYEIVCDMEKHRRVMHIKESCNKKTGAWGLTIDDDAVFESILHSYRTIKEIRVSGGFWSTPLNKRQLEQMSAILKKLGATVTCLNLIGVAISTNSIRAWVHRTPKLESLIITDGTVTGPTTKKASMPLQFSSLKKLETDCCGGLSHIVNLLPAGSLNDNYTAYNVAQSAESTESLKTILAKQHNIKSVHLCDFSDRTVLCVNHLQLETLIMDGKVHYNDDKLIAILKYHMNLKELRFTSYELSESSFKWICNNLKALQFLEVSQLTLQEKNVFESLAELTNLRHFRVAATDFSLTSSLALKSDSLKNLEFTGSQSFCVGKTLNKMVLSMVKGFTRLTYLKMNFDDFDALSFVLSHCTTLIHLSSGIRDASPYNLSHRQRFPHIKYLELSTHSQCKTNSYDMNLSISYIAQAMPNLRSLTLSLLSKLSFSIHPMRKLMHECKSLDYFYVDSFELSPNWPTDEFVEAIRCLVDRLKGYQLTFNIGSRKELHSNTTNAILRSEFYVREVPNSTLIYLYKGETKNFRKYF